MWLVVCSHLFQSSWCIHGISSRIGNIKELTWTSLMLWLLLWSVLPCWTESNSLLIHQVVAVQVETRCECRCFLIALYTKHLCCTTTRSVIHCYSVTCWCLGLGAATGTTLGLLSAMVTILRLWSLWLNLLWILWNVHWYPNNLNFVLFIIISECKI